MKEFILKQKFSSMYAQFFQSFLFSLVFICFFFWVRKNPSHWLKFWEKKINKKNLFTLRNSPYRNCIRKIWWNVFISRSQRELKRYGYQAAMVLPSIQLWLLWHISVYKRIHFPPKHNLGPSKWLVPMGSPKIDTEHKFVYIHHGQHHIQRI